MKCLFFLPEIKYHVTQIKVHIDLEASKPDACTLLVYSIPPIVMNIKFMNDGEGACGGIALTTPKISTLICSI
jgi:hypothetical protein